MTNRIGMKFKELKRRMSKAFIAYITAGDPSLIMTGRIVMTLEASGVDIIELGIPFSDPLADGPTIQAASQRALQKGTNLKKIFETVKSLRKRTDIPLAFMTYYNPVLKYGLRRFIMDCRGCGVDGVIVPDLPYEEADELIRLGSDNGIATINLVAPTSTRDRIRDIANLSTGFIYYVSLTGVTGSRETLPPEIASKVRLVKSLTPKPVCVGFGVSNPAQARNIARACDGVIVGSAIVKIIEKNAKSPSKMLFEISRFAKSLARAIHNV